MRKTSVRPHFHRCWPWLVILGGCGNDSVETAPAAVLTPIADVQGNSDTSPYEGRVVTVTGIVSGDFQDGDADDARNLGGFFLQAVSPDDDPLTSDGIFVFDGDGPGTDVVAGQAVQVQGTVAEHFGETQINASSVTITGSGEIESTILELPTDTRLNSDGEAIADLERFEGMLVTLASPAVVTEAFNLGRYGELTLVQGERLWQFTNEFRPDKEGFALHRLQHAARSLILDDGSTVQNPDEIKYLQPGTSDSAGYRLRLGDAVTSVTGNIRFSRGSGASGTESYRLEPTAEPEFAVRNARPVTRPDTGGAITVASFNVLNYFTTIDAGQSVCGPAADAGCRGADSEAELRRQRAKIIRALVALDADIAGLMELENNGDVAIRDIVAGLNAEAGDGAWDYIATGFIGADTITVGLIYRTRSVEPAGDFAILDASVDSRFDDSKNRPTLAQSFDTTGGRRITVAVNHLKSKGSECNDVGDPNLDDGQGECSQTRARAAAALGDWLNADPTGSGSPDILVIGDMNAYLREDPVITLAEKGFVNLLDENGGVNAYSFVFDGQAGALDHAFASRTLAPRISGVAEWHINADEPSLIDYNLDFGRDSGWFDETTPFRASDHDPVIVGINP